eukprot:CAMPEP_0170545122 /NCGR_PEP_ID=MMETSP0211-20121228/3628_1 /TAXON_ID=311385 /ORGANISM="Pseudokeronopsis sp., Strain OXSARD2" /LENGTH=102 /DNA_ID=CAMNT_0010848945 /DNA_START=837 /DNA_END=1145 /DNA_ORIENTATION=+
MSSHGEVQGLDIPIDIVQLVHIQRVPLVVHHIKHPLLVAIGPAFAIDDVLDEFDILGADVELVFVHHEPQELPRGILMGPIALRVDELEEGVVEDVGEGAVA